MNCYFLSFIAETSITHDINKSISAGEGSAGFGLRTADFETITSTIRCDQLHCPKEERGEIQNGSHANPVWIYGCSWLVSIHRKIKRTNVAGQTTQNQRPLCTTSLQSSGSTTTSRIRLHSMRGLCSEPTGYRTRARRGKVDSVFT